MMPPCTTNLLVVEPPPQADQDALNGDPATPILAADNDASV
jgi:hypothetical protein